MKLRILYITLLILATFIGQAQKFPKKGVPLLKNYPPSQYHNKGKIWDISTSPNGLVYMASDYGLLEFDGEKWKSFVGSKGVTRSVLTISDSIIYTGSDLDFGVWHRTAFNNFEYKSLYPFKEDVQDVFEEFWHIYQLKDIILFVSSQNIYIYKNGQITRLKVPTNITESFIYNDTLCFADEKYGLYYFDKLSLNRWDKFPDVNKINIVGLFKQDEKTVILSKNNGLYSLTRGAIIPINSKLSKFLKEAKVFSFERIDSSYLAFGTILKGVIITDHQGNIIHYINKLKGLLCNTILSMHYSPSGKLWLGMDYGIASLFLHNNITYFYDYQGNYGTGQVATLVGNEFYLGTNQGLYHAEWDALNDDSEYSNFNLIPKTEGQVWTLLNYNNQLLMGHDHGLFMFKNNKFLQIGSQEGVLCVLPYQDFLIAGTYNGISIYKKTNYEWIFQKKMELISGSCNQLFMKDSLVLWINIPNYGVIRAELNQDLTPISRKIFPTSNFNGNKLFLSNNNDTINVLTEENNYEFNSKTEEFDMIKNNTSFSKPENILSGVYQSTSLNTDYSFYSIYNGFALAYLKNSREVHEQINVPIFRDFSAYNNKHKNTIYYGSTVTYNLNNIHIDFLVPNEEEVFYQYKLNKDDVWSPWSKDHMVEFVGLSYGDYQFKVRAKIHNQISEINALPFEIAKPWTLSWQAYMLYLIVTLFFMFIFYLWRKTLIKKEKQKMLVEEQKSIKELTDKHEETVKRLEQEKIKSEYELLKQQLKSKTVELANKSKEGEDKNRLLLSLQEKFAKMQDYPRTSKSTLNEIRRILNSYINTEDHTFEIQMDELHQEFFKKLKDHFPNLSNNDLRLCAYIKVGLNSKEIADIMNIRPSSSYINRSRLRKKLNLNTEVDLYDFLNKF